MGKIESYKAPQGIEPKVIQLLDGVIDFFGGELSNKYSLKLETADPEYEKDRVTVSPSPSWMRGFIKFYARVGYHTVGWTLKSRNDSQSAYSPQMEVHLLVGAITGYYRDKFKPDDDPGQRKTAVDYGFCYEEGGNVVIPGLDHELVLTPSARKGDRSTHGTLSLRDIASQSTAEV